MKTRVSVSTDYFRFAHGRQPRGTGCWWFFDAGSSAWSFSFSGTFSAARKAAVASARAAGVSRVSVGS